MDVKIRVEGLDRIKKLLKQAPAVTANELSRAVERSVETIATKARREAPWNKQTGGGQLAQSIKTNMAGRFSGEVTAHAPYSAYVHEGTRPHLIQAKQKKALANVRTGDFFGKTVRHPGTQANPFLKRAVEKSKDAINQAFDRVIQNIIKRIT